MKKIVIFTFLAMVIVCSIFALDANAERLIVGTWTDNDGDTWVFNANGSFTFNGRSDPSFLYTGTQLFFHGALNISIHSNGRIMILSTYQDDESYVLRKN